MRRSTPPRKSPARALNLVESEPPVCEGRIAYLRLQANLEALANPDLHDEVIEVFASVPTSQRQRVYWALELALSAPPLERCRILDELKDAIAPPAAAQHTA